MQAHGELLLLMWRLKQPEKRVTKLSHYPHINMVTPVHVAMHVSQQLVTSTTNNPKGTNLLKQRSKMTDHEGCFATNTPTNGSLTQYKQHNKTARQ